MAAARGVAPCGALATPRSCQGLVFDDDGNIFDADGAFVGTIESQQAEPATTDDKNEAGPSEPMASKSLGALGLDMDKEKLLACLRRAGDPHVQGDKPTCVLFTNKIPVETCERMEELAMLKRGLALRALYLEGEGKDHARLFRELADLAASTVPPLVLRRWEQQEPPAPCRSTGTASPPREPHAAGPMRPLHAPLQHAGPTSRSTLLEASPDVASQPVGLARRPSH